MTRFGIAFTAHNRQALLDDSLAAVKAFTPADVPVVVVDDGSTPPLVVPEWVTLVRHDEPQGIPAAKNACLTALMALGVDHLFLFDEDTRPAADGWWEPYVNGAEPHYQYCWTHFADGRYVPKMEVLYADTELVGYGWSMGCLLYVTRHVVERVGGYDLAFTPGFEEHGEYSQRVHNAGFTTFVHQDHPAMRDNIWAADQHYAATRSFQRDDITRLVERNERLRLDRIDSTAYVEYRPPRDVVLTSYFTTHPDPQRGTHWPTTPDALEPLIESVGGDRMVVFHDLATPPTGAETVAVTPAVCAYQQRWLTQWQWLRAHPEARYVWMVDATDVTMLNDPFPHMRPGTLYCGWENQTVDNHWLRKHSQSYPDWVHANAHHMLLNCGVVGGDRNTMLTLAKRMTDLWANGTRQDPLEEMTFLNIAAREHPNLITGPQVTSLFKGQVLRDIDPRVDAALTRISSSRSFWQHK